MVQSIRGKLQQKAAKASGKHPFVIALQDSDFVDHADEDDVVTALFGDDEITRMKPLDGRPAIPGSSRARNGFWWGGEPRRRLVSGVLFCWGGIEQARKTRLSLNPMAQLPLSGPLLQLPHRRLGEDRYERRAGLHRSALLRDEMQPEEG